MPASSSIITRLLVTTQVVNDLPLSIESGKCHHGFVSVPRTGKHSTDIHVRSNILSLPFRKTHSVSLAEALKQYISKKYDQHPDMFAQDLEAIDRLRTDAVTSLEPHVSGIRKIAAYAAQLVWIGGKVPY